MDGWIMYNGIDTIYGGSVIRIAYILDNKIFECTYMDLHYSLPHL